MVVPAGAVGFPDLETSRPMRTSIVRLALGTGGIRPEAIIGLRA
ncbi:MAG: hypothetical protein QM589_07650 [Thermomicrobiales bacterium]